jgi:hypothetical protein
MVLPNKRIVIIVPMNQLIINSSPTKLRKNENILTICQKSSLPFTSLPTYLSYRCTLLCPLSSLLCPTVYFTYVLSLAYQISVFMWPICTIWHYWYLCVMCCCSILMNNDLSLSISDNRPDRFKVMLLASMLQCLKVSTHFRTFLFTHELVLFSQKNVLTFLI